MSEKSDLWENDPSLVTFGDGWAAQQQEVYFETVARLGRDPEQVFLNYPDQLATYRSWVASK